MMETMARGRPDADVDTDQLDLAREFTEFRPRLLGIAYRMLGSAWDAEDVVAEAMVRWMGVDRAHVREPLAYLTTIVTHLALDQLRSARAARETYVGEWLPEPLLADRSTLGPLDTVEHREQISLATLRMMETLSPPERAVLVLHEAFDLPHAEIAAILDISEAGARQHLRRARAHLAAARPRFAPELGIHDVVFERFLSALERGDLDDVQELLAADVVAYSDGGGKARAARYPIAGAARSARFYASLRRRLPVRGVRRIEVNGHSAALLQFGREQLLLSVDVSDGKIREIDSILNPDKLRYLRRQLGEPT